MSADACGAGLFVAVVGPSGAGKDTLIRSTKAALAGDPRFVFPQRLITRPADETEDALEISREAWECGVADGSFALSWQAHGLAYAIPGDTRDAVAHGRTVVANLSRRVLPGLTGAYPRAAAICITATPETLAHRLAARSRENAAARSQRLSRRAPAMPAGLTWRTVANDGTPEEGAAAFLAALAALTPELLTA